MTEQIYAFPARIAPAEASHFPIDQALLERYRKRYPDNGDIKPFFLRTEISNNSLDWYFTHMLTSSLQNYAADSDNGVGVQDSHDTRKLSYGRSLYGEYQAVEGEPEGWTDRALAIPKPDRTERVLSVAAIIPGLNFNNMTFASTDDFIRAVKTGSVETVSIGFGGADFECDICQANYFSWDCRHIAGFTYEAEGDDDVIRNILSTVGIDKARLLEYSAVYAGATPNAVVVRKAHQEIEGGRLTPKQAEIIEQRYRVSLPLSRIWPVLENVRGDDMAGKEENPTSGLDPIRALLAEAKAEGDDELEKVRWLVSENARLTVLADQGRQYRDDITADALAEGVRAMGDDFPAETYQNILRGATLDHIKELRDGWRTQGDARLKPGRKTQNGEDPTPETVAVAIVPSGAYSS